MRATTSVSHQRIMGGNRRDLWRYVSPWLPLCIAAALITLGIAIWRWNIMQTTTPTVTSAFVIKGNIGSEAVGHIDVLLVPSRALYTEHGDQVVRVRLATDLPAVSVRVQTGLRSDEQTEIVSCLDTGKQCLEVGDELVITATSDH